MLLHERIESLLYAAGVRIEGGLQNSSSLIRSGLLDSLALLNLALWIQEEVGPEIDLTAFDLAKEWDTLSDIEEFIERHRAGA